eukprot:6677730-Prymnesium_polylepis.2
MSSVVLSSVREASQAAIFVRVRGCVSDELSFGTQSEVGPRTHPACLCTRALATIVPAFRSTVRCCCEENQCSFFHLAAFSSHFLTVGSSRRTMKTKHTTRKFMHRR